LKKDVTDARYGLQQVLELRPVTFKWKSEIPNEGAVQLGLIAQEVQKVVPEVVKQDPRTGTLSINYAALVPVTIKAVQEQEKLIRQQQVRIDALEHARGPMVSSFFSGSALEGGVVFGLLPFALIVAFRRRINREHA
jgi:hypothetical protein